jgi:hypothetical protein
MDWDQSENGKIRDKYADCSIFDFKPRLPRGHGGAGARSDRESTLVRRNAAMQHYGMTITLPVSKRGSLTLPPAVRQKMGLDKLLNPMVLVEEREGGLFLQAAVALPVRDLPKKQIEQWIARDEAEMAAFRAVPRKTKQ